MAFTDELREATRLLADFNRQLKIARSTGGVGAGSGGGGGGGGLSGIVGGLSGGKSFLGAAGPAGAVLAGLGIASDMVSGAAQFATPAARSYALTGSTAAFNQGLLNSGLDAIQGTGVGGLLSNLSGLAPARDVAGRAGQRVLSLTEDLRRANIPVNDDFRRRYLDVVLQQEKRAELEREAVGQIANSPETLRKTGFADERVIGALEKILGVLNSFSTKSGAR